MKTLADNSANPGEDQNPSAPVKRTLDRLEWVGLILLGALVLGAWLMVAGACLLH
jgi:hypothetical protein